MPIQIGKSQATTMLKEAAAKLNTLSLANNIMELRRSRSGDRIQQVQTDAIVQLYDAVKQIQEALWPMLNIIPDGVDAVRQAAQGQSTGTSTLQAANKFAPGRFTK